MKASFLLMLMVFLTLGELCAQQVDNYRQDTTTLYQRAKGFSTDPIRSKWRQQVKQEDGAWVLYLYDKKDILQEKITFADKNLLERKGAYIRYKEGNIKETGRYDKGYKMGEWNRFYLNKQVAEKRTYTWDKLVTETYFDEKGKSVDRLQVIQPPSYPGGIQAFDQFLLRTIKYPLSAVKDKIEGAVTLQFTVNKEGYLESIKVVQNPNVALSNEAIRVLKQSGKWNPGMEFGEVVDAQYSVPIKFSIHN